ncbi:MAG: hypothetical protein ABIF88_01120 [archaeon]
MDQIQEKRLRDLVLDNPSNPSRQIRTKRQNYALFNNLNYGNRPLTWETKEEIYKSGWYGGVCIRDLRGTNRGDKNAPLPKYDLPRDSLDDYIFYLIKQGIPESRMTFNQSLPNDHLAIQGEISIIDGIYHLSYTNIKKPMLLAFKDELKTARGLRARKIIENFLDPRSLSDLEYCLTNFSTSSSSNSPAVEFSTYDVLVGDAPARNTIIWEVRNY